MRALCNLLCRMLLLRDERAMGPRTPRMFAVLLMVAVLFSVSAGTTSAGTAMSRATATSPADRLAVVTRYAPPRVFPDSIGPSEQRDSIVAEQARRWGMPVELALAISHTENWTGDSTAKSRAGAIGLMQIMPSYWEESFYIECGFVNLTHRRRNACVGVLVALDYFEKRGNWDAALRDYNGARCRPKHGPTHCARMERLGNAYVATVMQKIFRTDLSIARDVAYRAEREGKNNVASGL